MVKLAQSSIGKDTRIFFTRTKEHWHVGVSLAYSWNHFYFLLKRLLVYSSSCEGKSTTIFLFICRTKKKKPRYARNCDLWTSSNGKTKYIWHDTDERGAFCRTSRRCRTVLVKSDRYREHNIRQADCGAMVCTRFLTLILKVETVFQKYNTELCRCTSIIT